MQINIEAVLRRGVDRTVARNGLLLVGILFVVSTVNAIVGLGVARWVANRGVFPTGVPFPRGTGAAAALFAVPPGVGGLVSLLAGLVTVVLTIGALRLFVSDETERLPREYFTRNLVWPGLNFIVGTVVFAVIVGFGLVLFVVPGVFLLVALAFWTVYVAVEDRGFVAGMRESWALTRGRRTRLFLLGVAVVLVQILVSAVFGIGGPALGLLGVVLGQAGSALATVFALATLAAAYEQLLALPAEEEPVTTDRETASPA
jgi:hypothetical protein